MSDMDTEFESASMRKISHPPVLKAHEMLRALSAAPEFRRMAEERERFLREAEMDRKYAETQGKANILRHQLRVKFGRSWSIGRNVCCLPRPWSRCSARSDMHSKPKIFL